MQTLTLKRKSFFELNRTLKSACKRQQLAENRGIYLKLETLDSICIFIKSGFETGKTSMSFKDILTISFMGKSDKLLKQIIFICLKTFLIILSFYNLKQLLFATNKRSNKLVLLTDLLCRLNDFSSTSRLVLKRYKINA